MNAGESGGGAGGEVDDVGGGQFLDADEGEGEIIAAGLKSAGRKSASYSREQTASHFFGGLKSGPRRRGSR